MGQLLTFYKRGAGSSNYWVEKTQSVLSDEEWARIIQIGVALLRKRGHGTAADILEMGNFKICEGVNDFRDDFHVLYRQVDLEEYVGFDEYSRSEEYRNACRDLAVALSELGHHVRFVGVELVSGAAPQPVAAPRPKVTSAAVEAALKDAEQMLAQKRPVSAVDRAHTALHGYLLQVCNDANIAMTSKDPALTELVKMMIKQHPKFSNLGPHKDQIEKILKAMGVTCDALNPIRNHGSLAHANESLLEPAEAALAINATRTILHYVHQKVEP